MESTGPTAEINLLLTFPFFAPDCPIHKLIAIETAGPAA